VKTESFADFAAPLLLLLAACAGEGRAEELVATASAAPSASAPLAEPPPPPTPAVTTSASASAAAPAAPPVLFDAGLLDACARSPIDCPDGMAKIGRTCIDRWEAFLVTRAASGEITPLPFFARPPEDGNYEARSEAGAFPQGYISRVEAARACKNAGKRLCSMGEWQRACSGRRGAHYPYGQKLVASRCNMDKGHLLSQRFGPDARKWKYEQFNDPTLNQEPGFLARAGEYDDCTNESGAFDMVGNLHEWVSDTVDQALVDRLEAEPIERKHQGWKEGNGVFMGGFFSTHEQLGPGCKYTTIAHEPTYHDYSTGFRCCATLPKPPKETKAKTKR
jgi:hypothetical protein